MLRYIETVIYTLLGSALTLTLTWGVVLTTVGYPMYEEQARDRHHQSKVCIHQGGTAYNCNYKGGWGKAAWQVDTAWRTATPSYKIVIE